MEVIDCHHPEWGKMLEESPLEFKSTIHHFEREGDTIKPVLWCDVPFTPRRDERTLS